MAHIDVGGLADIDRLELRLQDRRHRIGDAVFDQRVQLELAIVGNVDGVAIVVEALGRIRIGARDDDLTVAVDDVLKNIFKVWDIVSTFCSIAYAICISSVSMRGE